MSILFAAVLKMSFYACAAAIIVIVLRFFLRKLPKIYSYALWSIVLFRLLCPVGLPISIKLEAEPAKSFYEEIADNTSSEYIPAPNFDHSSAEKPNETNPVKKNKADTMTLLGINWLVGVSAMAVCAIISHVMLKMRLFAAIKSDKGIYESDRIDTAFVFGIISPKIYLPASLSNTEAAMVLLHEQTHIKRRDHIIKLVAYIALGIHWFNPLMWLCFKLMCNDMESSCDEAVIRKMNKDGVYEYCKTLLSVSSKHHYPLPTFSESSTKERIQNIVSFRAISKSAATALIFLFALVLAACSADVDIKRIEAAPTNPNYGFDVFYQSVDEKYSEYVSLKNPLHIQAITDKESNEKYAAVMYCHRDYAGQITIPDEFEGLPIRQIYPEAFMGCSKVTNVILPQTLYRIREYAFASCTSLKTASFPDNVNVIEKFAYSNCTSLERAELPPYMMRIGMYAFENCGTLEEITISEGLSDISNSLFTGCSALEKATLPKSIKIIGGSAFEGCTSLTEITLPDGLAVIGTKAFYNCKKLKNVYGLDNLDIIINEWAFENTRVVTNSSFEKSYAHSYLFAYHATDLVTVDIPNGYTSAGEFSKCTNLVSVKLPDTMIFVNHSAFEGCEKLKEVYIPASVKYIGDFAFQGCDAMTVYTPKGSYAEQWAKENGFNYEEWNE